MDEFLEQSIVADQLYMVTARYCRVAYSHGKHRRIAIQIDPMQASERADTSSSMEGGGGGSSMWCRVLQAFSSRSCCVPSTWRCRGRGGVHCAPWGRILPRRRAAALSGQRRTGRRGHVVAEPVVCLAQHRAGAAEGARGCRRARHGPIGLDGGRVRQRQRQSRL